mgnify:CR=1 FL=1
MTAAGVEAAIDLAGVVQHVTLIEFADAEGARWSTVGVSANIIDASFQALVDAINYGELYQMPPKGRLPAEEVATLVKWVEMGAPWPGEQESGVRVRCPVPGSR